MATYFNLDIADNGSLKSSQVIIDNNNPLMAGSEYGDMDFNISGTPPTREQLKKYRRESTSKKGIFDQSDYYKKIWLNHVTDWHLIAKNKREIPFSEGNKIFLVENMPGFTTGIAQCLIDGYAKEDPAEKNLKTSGDGE